MKRMIRNNLITRIICYILAFVLLSTTSSFAVIEGETGSILKKTESVYVNTDSYGNVEKVNIYNYFDIANVDEIAEYGEYESIQTVTGENIPSVSGDKITWNVSGDKRLGYIGKASAELANQMPWNIEIKYYLNGVETLASELPHQKGLVKVSIKVLPNKLAPEYYQNNYMMQISASFDMKKYISVHSEEAIEAQVGNTKSLTYMILPGHEKEVNIEIGTEDFKMDSITFAMFPLEGDMLELIQDFVEDKNSVREALDMTNESLDIILNGLSITTKSLEKIIGGSKSIQSGLSVLNENNSQRINNIDELKSELKLLVGEIDVIDEKIDKIIENNDYLKDRINSGDIFVTNLNSELKELNAKFEENEKDLERLHEESKNIPDDLRTLDNLIISLKDSISSLRSLLKDVDATGGINMNALSRGLVNIKENTEEIATEAGIKLQNGGSDPEFYMDVVSSAKSIGESLQSVSNELTKAQKSMNSIDASTADLALELKAVQEDLDETSSVIKRVREYSKDIPEFVENLSATLDSLEKIIDSISQEIDSNSETDKNKLLDEIDNLTNLLKDLKIVKKDIDLFEDTLQNSLNVLKSDLNIISNDIYSSSNVTIDGMNDLLKNLKTVTGQSSTLKEAKNQIHDIITSDVDDIENKTTIFQMNQDTPVVSFASSKNEAPKKVQMFIQTKAIKGIKKQDTSDLEPQKEKASFLDKIKEVINIVVEFFKDLFNNK